MHRFSALILGCCCAAVLLLQASGLHLHATLEPGNAGLHAEHFHVADADGHDHASDLDVSLMELGLWAKLYPLLLILAPLFLLVPMIVGRSRYQMPATPAVFRPIHWRPPLRAPPSRH